MKIQVQLRNSQLKEKDTTKVFAQPEVGACFVVFFYCIHSFCNEGKAYGMFFGAHRRGNRNDRREKGNSVEGGICDVRCFFRKAER